VSENPYLLEHYQHSDPEDAFLSFLFETSIERTINSENWNEMDFLNRVLKDFQKHGPKAHDLKIKKRSP
jgi:hypothetical protein